MVYFDRSKLDISDLEFEISISVKCYDEKTVENYRNCYVAEKRLVSKLSKVQGVPKRTDRFQSFIIQNVDNLLKFFSYH